MAMTEVGLVAQENKLSKRFMLRWHNWSCDHVTFGKSKYPSCEYGYPLDVEPYAWLAYMSLYFYKKCFAYKWSYLVPFKHKCRKGD